MKRLIIDPLFLFAAIWLAVFWLFSLHWSRVLLPMQVPFALWSLGTLCAAVIGYVVGRMLSSLSTQTGVGLSMPESRIRKILAWLGFAMLIVMPIEILYSGGIPLLWYLTGTGKTYVDYGIPTLHGLFNAVLLFTGTTSFWMITTRRGKLWIKALFLFCLSVPLVAVTRQLLMSLIVQCFIVYVGARVKDRQAVVLRLVVGASIALAVFGIVGDFRSNNDLFRVQADLTPGTEWLPTGILWPYMYLTTPINNLLYLTQAHLPRTHGAASLSTLTPTIFRTMLFGREAHLAPVLVRDTFNVTSYATPLYLDFGWPGVVAFTAMMMLLAGLAAGRFRRTNDVHSLLSLAVFDEIIFFSFFVNFLLTWGVVFQLVLLILLRSSLRSSARVIEERRVHVGWLRRLIGPVRPSGSARASGVAS